MGESITNTKRPGRKTNQAGNIKPAPATNSNNPSATDNTTSDTTRNYSTSEPTGDPTNHTETEQKPPRLVILDKPATPAATKPKRNRPSGMTYNKAAKAQAAIKSGGAGAGTVVMIQSVIQGVFLIGAARLGEHWVLTDEESEAIASPTANILAKYIDADKMAKFSDPAALMFALGAVMIPRVMIQVQQAPKKGVKANGGNSTQPTGPAQPDTSGARATGSGTNGSTDNRDTTGSSKDDDSTHVEKLLRDAINSPY